MKKFFAFLLLFLLIAAGLGYLLYPIASDQLGQYRDAEVMKAYREKTAVMDAEQKTAHFQEAADYNAALESIRIEDVFTAGTPRTSRDYQNRMNVHSGVIGELVIPRTGTTLPVYHNSAETPAKEKLVHLEVSSLPADQAPSNIVLAGPGTLKAEGVLGDIGLTDDRMLEHLEDLIPGDLMILNVLDRTMVYQVTEAQTLSPAGLKELDLTPGPEDDRLTVISRRSDRRLLVQAERITVAHARTLLEEDDRATFPETWQSVMMLGSPVILAGLLILWIIERIKKHSYLLPGEGRQAAKREKKAREKLDHITTTTSEGEKA
uniref:Sortase n=1 Tax=uncultured bacterium Contigcl_1764b TaxID=1393658 RepID=W0FMF1_9BACT|nr:sortase [uncultured bacterium Contigcl_1764b]